jgi:asparagine synthase (glutamine-hydrolysing)
MCGITAILSSGVDAAEVLRMNDLIRHRGPNDEGFTFFADARTTCVGGKDTPPEAFTGDLAFRPESLIQDMTNVADCYLAFGHRRLSIVDLSVLGHQPMCDREQHYWITYNGEIYNHVELRKELEALGHTFFSHSDTEVILAAYREWGESCQSRFDGMWAFIIHDRKQGSLFISRDRFGIKPLYYWGAPDGTLAFASEIKQFTEMTGWQAKLNSQRAYDFLAWSILDHTTETLFDRVYQLAPGCCANIDVKKYLSMVASDGRLPSTRWYKLEAAKFTGNFDDATRDLRARLTNAVRSHLRADVPVGSCLSGGLDSSSIVCLIDQLLREEQNPATQKTFSACADVKRFDERVWIDQVVDATGVEAHYVYPAIEDLFATIPSLVWHQDEPFGSTSIYAQWQVFKSAADNGATVMLDGQGADEQLAGYHGFFSPLLGSLFKRGRWFALAREIRAMQKLHGYSLFSAGKFLANSLLPEDLRDFMRRKAGRTNGAPEWLDIRQLGCINQDPFRAAGAVGTDSVRDLSIAQLTASNLQMLLHWEDRDSMAHSIESRVPFLDHRLVEFALGLPDEYKLANGITKRVLRQAMRGILPDPVRNRMDKLGFVTPEEIWLREQAPKFFRERLIFAIDRSRGIIKEDALKMFEEIVDGTRPFNFFIWRLISFGEWLERFDVAMIGNN